MKPVSREDILDYQTYEETREEFREEVMRQKRRRRVHLGDHLTFLFENPLTIRYQVQEMMRAERIVREADILHELTTYNALLGDRGELGATLLIEIEVPEERDRLLREWLALPHHLYAVLDDDTRVAARFDAGQVGEDRLSSVQYLVFPVEGRVPTRLGCDLPGHVFEAPLTEEQRVALAEDLRADD